MRKVNLPEVNTVLSFDRVWLPHVRSRKRRIDEDRRGSWDRGSQSRGVGGMKSVEGGS
jgi:hypothetical protein